MSGFGTVNDFNKVMDAIRYLREKELSTVESLDTYLDTVSGQAVWEVAVNLIEF